MPRPQLYHTEAERTAAHRARNRIYYQRHRDKILSSKKNARKLDNLVLTQAERKQHRNIKHKRRAPGRGQDGAGIPKTVVAKPYNDPQTICRRELLGMLDALKSEYTKNVEPWPYPYLNELCLQTFAWQKRNLQRGVLYRDLSKSPILLAEAQIRRLWDRYESLEGEFYYSIKGHDDQSWEDEIELFTAFRTEALKMLEVLEDLQAAVQSNTLKDQFDDFGLLFHSLYSPRVTTIFPTHS
ncbi:hypothetical protein PQX77_016048 [Marasmius sp. AFHP31]|nr:hypothetical protein PQX77_016048 [Marasmius sp. AFHP31]